MKTAEEIFESGAMLVTDNNGNEQYLMNKGTFVAILSQLHPEQSEQKKEVVDSKAKLIILFIDKFQKQYPTQMVMDVVSFLKESLASSRTVSEEEIKEILEEFLYEWGDENKTYDDCLSKAVKALSLSSPKEEKEVSDE